MPVDAHVELIQFPLTDFRPTLRRSNCLGRRPSKAACGDVLGCRPSRWSHSSSPSPPREHTQER